MAKRKKEQTEVEALLDQLLEGLSPEEVMGKEGLMQELQKAIMERMLEGELTAHLGYERHAPEGRNRGNSRNGHSCRGHRQVGALGTSSFTHVIG